MSKIIGYIVNREVLDEVVPESFFDGIEEPYSVTFRDYCQWINTQEESINVILEITKKIGANGYSDCTNYDAWLNYFNEEAAIWD